MLFRFIELKKLHVEIFESEIKRLSGEVSNGVCKVSLIVGFPSLFDVEPFEAVDDSYIGPLDQLLLDERSLQLQSYFDDFDGGSDCFGNGGRSATHCKLGNKLF